MQCFSSISSIFFKSGKHSKYVLVAKTYHICCAAEQINCAMIYKREEKDSMSHLTCLWL